MKYPTLEEIESCYAWKHEGELTIEQKRLAIFGWLMEIYIGINITGGQRRALKRLKFLKANGQPNYKARYFMNIVYRGSK